MSWAKLSWKSGTFEVPRNEFAPELYVQIHPHTPADEESMIIILPTFFFFFFILFFISTEFQRILDIKLLAQQICSGQNPAWDDKGKPKGWPKERQSDFKDNSIVRSSTCWSMFQIDFGICNWPICALLHPFLTYPWKYDMDPSNAGGRGRLSSSFFAVIGCM